MFLSVLKCLLQCLEECLLYVLDNVHYSFFSSVITVYLRSSFSCSKQIYTTAHTHTQIVLKQHTQINLNVIACSTFAILGGRVNIILDHC